MKLRMSLIMAGLVALVSGCAAGGAGTSSGSTAAPTAQGEQIAQGERERRNEMTRAAERALEDAQDPENAANAATLYQEALTAAEAAIAADPTNPLPHLQAAYANAGLGNYGAAAEMFDRAEFLRPIYELETERQREQIWIELYQQGANAVNSGQYEEAAQIFRDADAIYGARPEVKVILGQLLVSLGQYDEGVEVLESAMSLIESDRINEMDSVTAENWRASAADIPVTIATAYVNGGRYEEARTSLRALLAEEPNNTSYLNSLAGVFMRMEMPDSAKVIYDRLLSMDGLDATDYYNIGVGRYQGSDFVGAAAAFNRAAEASTNDRDAIEMYARSMQIAYGQNADAMEPPAGALENLFSMANRWKDLDPNNRNAYLIAAQTANRLGNEDAARENVAAIEALPFTVDNLTLQRSGSGGGTLVGILHNVSVNEGTPIRLEFTFYDANGSSIGTQSWSMPAPAADGTREIRVDFMSDQKIHGYSYSAGM